MTYTIRFLFLSFFLLIILSHCSEENSPTDNANPPVNASLINDWVLSQHIWDDGTISGTPFEDIKTYLDLINAWNDVDSCDYLIIQFLDGGNGSYQSGYESNNTSYGLGALFTWEKLLTDSLLITDNLTNPSFSYSFDINGTKISLNLVEPTGRWVFTKRE